MTRSRNEEVERGLGLDAISLLRDSCLSRTWHRFSGDKSDASRAEADLANTDGGSTLELAPTYKLRRKLFNQTAS